MGERFRTFWFGIFIIGSIGIIAWLLLFLRPSVGDADTVLQVHFSNIERISVGTRVNFAGKPVGEVKEINEIGDGRTGQTDDEGNIYFFELVLRVDSSVQVYNYDEIMFTTSGLLGEKSIAINPKVAPPGMPAAYDVTEDVLYGRSMDKIEETLNEMLGVASSLDEAIAKVGDLIDDNKEELHDAISSFATASDEARELLASANESDFATKASEAATQLNSTMSKADTLITQAIDKELVNRLGDSVDQVRDVSARIASGEGTLGRLIYDDTLHLQFSATMSRLETTLNDINNYGLLFQYDKGWQRKRTAKANRMHKLCSPCDFYNYFNDELCEVSTALNRVTEALETVECRDVPLDNECFAQKFSELMCKVANLEEHLKQYNHKLRR